MKSGCEYTLSNKAQYGEKIRIDEKLKNLVRELISIGLDIDVKIVLRLEEKKPWYKKIFK